MKVELFKLYTVNNYAIGMNKYISVLIVLTFRMKGIMGSFVDLI